MLQIAIYYIIIYIIIIYSEMIQYHTVATKHKHTLEEATCMVLQ